MQEELRLKSGDDEIILEEITQQEYFMLTAKSDEVPFVNFIADLEEAKLIRDWLNKYIEEHS